MVFWKKKEKDVVDLGILYERQKKKLAEIKEDIQEGSSSSDFVTYPASNSSLNTTPTNSSETNAMGFLGNLAGAGTQINSQNSDSPDSSSENQSTTNPLIQEKRKKLAKRLMDITTKLEDLGNQIYHLQQRIELVEKKLGSY